MRLGEQEGSETGLRERFQTPYIGAAEPKTRHPKELEPHVS